MSKLNPVAREPVLLAAVASIITWIAAYAGVKVDPLQASEIAGVVLLVAGVFARQLVRPVAKDEDQADDSTLRKVVGQVIAEMRKQPASEAEPERGLVAMPGVPPPASSTATGPPVDYDG